jgi:hypothetical protein
LKLFIWFIRNNLNQVVHTLVKRGLHGVYNLIEVISSWTEQKLRSILKYTSQLHLVEYHIIEYSFKILNLFLSFNGEKNQTNNDMTHKLFYDWKLFFANIKSKKKIMLYFQNEMFYQVLVVSSFSLIFFVVYLS